MATPTAEDIIREYERAESDRGTWKNHWQDIANFVDPTREFIHKVTPGAKRNLRIYQSQACVSSQKLAGMLTGFLVNPSLMWFSLGTHDEELNNDDDVQAWLQDTRNRMLLCFNNPRFMFNSSIHEVFTDLVNPGTGIMFIKTMVDGVRFLSRPLAECVILEDGDGLVNRLYRKFEFTPQQALEAWGPQALSDRTKEKLNSPQRYSQLCPYLHAVFPRDEYNPDRLDERNKPYASIYIELESKQIVSESGFAEFPFLCPRWTKAAGEIYGRSPAMNALSDIKMVNAMTKTVIVGTEKMVDPALMLPDDGFLAPFRTSPGSLNYYRAGSQDMVKPLETGGRPDLGEKIIERTLEAIKAAFWNDLVELPMIDRASAEEMRQRIADRSKLIAPVLGRIQTELLGPMIGYVFRMYARKGWLAPAPPSIRGHPLIVNYVGPLALSQKASEIDAVRQLVQVASPLISADPGAMGNFDVDEIIRGTASRLNMPSRFLKSRQAVAAARKQQAQAQAQAQQIASAQAVASAAKDGGAAAQSLQGVTGGV